MSTLVSSPQVTNKLLTWCCLYKNSLCDYTGVGQALLNTDMARALKKRETSMDALALGYSLHR